jgi:myosin-crossreactive antigen
MDIDQQVALTASPSKHVFPHSYMKEFAIDFEAVDHFLSILVKAFPNDTAMMKSFDNFLEAVKVEFKYEQMSEEQVLIVLRGFLIMAMND